MASLTDEGCSIGKEEATSLLWRSYRETLYSYTMDKYRIAPPRCSGFYP